MARGGSFPAHVQDEPSWMAALLQGQAEGNFPLSCPEELDSGLVQTWGASHVHVLSGSEKSGGFLLHPCCLLLSFHSFPLPGAPCRGLCCPDHLALGCWFFLPPPTVSGASLATFLEDAVGREADGVHRRGWLVCLAQVHSAKATFWRTLLWLFCTLRTLYDE